MWGIRASLREIIKRARDISRCQANSFHVNRFRELLLAYPLCVCLEKESRSKRMKSDSVFARGGNENVTGIVSSFFNFETFTWRFKVENLCCMIERSVKFE